MATLCANSWARELASLCHEQLQRLLQCARCCCCLRGSAAYMEERAFVPLAGPPSVAAGVLAVSQPAVEPLRRPAQPQIVVATASVEASGIQQQAAALQALVAQLDARGSDTVFLGKEQQVHAASANPEVVLVGAGYLAFHEITRLHAGEAIEINTAVDLRRLGPRTTYSPVFIDLIDKYFDRRAEFFL